MIFFLRVRMRQGRQSALDSVPLEMNCQRELIINFCLNFVLGLLVKYLSYVSLSLTLYILKNIPI